MFKRPSTSPGLLLFFVSLAGCVDTTGQRVTMQDMWHSWTRDNHAEPVVDAVDRRNGAVQPEPVSDTEPIIDAQSAKAVEQEQSAAKPPDGNAPSSPPRPPPSAIQSDVLIIDDDAISVGDILEPLNVRLERMSGELPFDQYMRQAADLVRQQIVEEVAQHLIWRKAKAQITDEMSPQLDKAVEKMEKDRINREFDGREPLYDQYLSRQNKTRSDVRERLRRTVVIDMYLRERLLPLAPTPRKSELLAYYNSHKDEFSSVERREMFLIDIPFAAFLDPYKPIAKSDAEIAEGKAREQIRAAKDALKAGRPFEDVAREYSEGLHKEEGGAWGFITRPPTGQTALQGRWAIPSTRLFQLPPGQASEIIEASKSYFIVKPGRIEGGQTLSFQKAQPQIEESIRRARFIKLRAEFLQNELQKSTFGSFDDFARQVMAAIPQKGMPSDR